MKTKYRISEIREVNELFQTYFKTSFRPFYDDMMTVIRQYICIDLTKFDDYLDGIHHHNDSDNASMSACIEREYGKEASEFIERLI